MLVVEANLLCLKGRELTLWCDLRDPRETSWPGILPLEI